jgi:hypothetical protein
VQECLEEYDHEPEAEGDRGRGENPAEADSAVTSTASPTRPALAGSPPVEIAITDVARMSP